MFCGQSHPQLLGDGRKMLWEQYGDALQQQIGSKHAREDALCLAMIVSWNAEWAVV